MIPSCPARRVPSAIAQGMAGAALFILWTTVATAQTLPHVHLIATGGTISNRDGGRLTADDLAKSLTGLEKHARLTHEQFANVASTQLTLDQWLGLARRVNELFETDKALAGIVITSGTDTLEETAFFLHLTVRDTRPVVLVGAMRTPSTLGYEGAANLLQGVRVAADATARDKGVLVVLNDEINSARDVTKTDALRLQTFQSRTHGLLGVVDRDRVAFFRQPLQRHTARTEFDIAGLKQLPRVDVVMVYQDAPGDLIKAAVDSGAKGIIIAGAGAGGISGTQTEGLDYAAQKGVFIVLGTRAGAGRIAPSRGDGPGGGQPSASQQRRRQFTVAAEDHAPLKARILLMLALTKTNTRGEIQRIFSEY
jgi:L-asparaginase